MNIPDDKKVDLLSTQLQERYSALHKMRDRSMQLVLWVLGFGFGLAWLSINEAILTTAQKVAITFLLIGMAIATMVFVHAITRGFKANRETIIRIESALGLYEPNCYGIEGTVLPNQFSCTKTGWTGHFATLYVLIAAVVLMLLVLTWTNPCAGVMGRESRPLDPNQTQSSLVQH
jgi:hypothetical protein